MNIGSAADDKRILKSRTPDGDDAETVKVDGSVLTCS